MERIGFERGVEVRRVLNGESVGLRGIENDELHGWV